MQQQMSNTGFELYFVFKMCLTAKKKYWPNKWCYLLHFNIPYSLRIVATTTSLEDRCCDMECSWTAVPFVKILTRTRVQKSCSEAIELIIYKTKNESYAILKSLQILWVSSVCMKTPLERSKVPSATKLYLNNLSVGLLTQNCVGTRK